MLGPLACADCPPAPATAYARPLSRAALCQLAHAVSTPQLAV